ncbi:MAG: extracellular solute-binding protein, partial [Eubacteriales bacterium]|nr:extracellular solute-binding protein [Eubacteriales bacterium]
GDVTWGGLADSDGMQYAELFEEWVSEESANAIDGYSTPNGIYSMDHLSTIVFAINTELEAELGLNITSYADLLDPALEGKIILSNPNSSSAAWNNLCNIMSVFGNDTDEAWDYIAKLMKNLVITDSSSNCFKLVEQGEYVVGLTYEDGAIKLIEQGAGDHFDMRYPADGASASAFGMAVIKNCQHPEAAKALVNWVCSADGCSYIAQYLKTLRMTNKDTVYGESLLPATEDIKWVTRDVPYLTEHKADILDHWNELLLEVQG